MKLRDVDEQLLQIITDSDHPEIAAVEVMATSERPDAHTRLRVDFASGTSAYIMVRRVAGPGVPRHTDYELPREVI